MRELEGEVVVVVVDMVRLRVALMVLIVEASFVVESGDCLFDAFGLSMFEVRVLVLGCDTRAVVSFLVVWSMSMLRWS